MLPMLCLLGLTYIGASVPFGLVVTTLYGDDTDLRSAGSGNIGATNVARVHGWGLAGPVVALDMAKGLVPVLLARTLWPEAGLWWPGLIAITAWVGHCFSIFLEFRGGKGVATGAGALLAIVPLPTLGAAALWTALLAGTGRSSVAALASATALVLTCSWLAPEALPVVAALGLGVAATHIPNMRRLIRGEEEQVLRPVRFSRGATDGPSVEQLLEQGPGGTSAGTAQWRDEPDPLEATDHEG